VLLAALLASLLLPLLCLAFGLVFLLLALTACGARLIRVRGLVFGAAPAAAVTVVLAFPLVAEPSLLLDALLGNGKESFGERARKSLVCLLFDKLPYARALLLEIGNLLSPSRLLGPN